ncbi:hypothetical protein ACFVYT_05020 [Streptomyces sp. NPDC058290]|uniref:hypothetical protein n=1 Tax=unclassified Streptomyces TaxID=2593676 RepID=UPI0036E9EB2E
MRRRLLGFIAAAVLAVLGVMGPAAQAAVSDVDVETCTKGGGTSEYESATGLWTCIDGRYNGEPIK